MYYLCGCECIHGKYGACFGVGGDIGSGVEMVPFLPL